MKIRNIILFVTAVLLAACANTDNSDGQIELNNGQKWLVNEEMKPHIEQGRLLLETYLREGDTDHKNLASKLQEQNTKLIRSCSMDGKSHDELHKWLYPHLELVKSLSLTKNPSEANDLTEKLQASYQVYDQYFD